MNNSYPYTELERTIQAAIDVPDPTPQFLTSLGDKLEAKAKARVRGDEQDQQNTRRYLEIFRRPAWQIVVVFLLVVAMSVLALGPQNVLAQVQRLIGYIPGIGFIDQKQARILSAPVEIHREGVTLKVEQVLAEPGRTLVIFSSQGLPAETIGYTPSSFPKPLIRLPDGSELEAVWEELHYGGGKIEFFGLPEDIYRITFEIDRLPMLPPGTAPESWKVPLLLRPATGEPPDEIYPQLYEPIEAFADVNRVKVRILQVAQSAEDTGLQVMFEWENQDWELADTYHYGELHDDLGYLYRTFDHYSQSSSAMVVGGKPDEWEKKREMRSSPSVETYHFPALSLAAREAIFRLPSLSFFVPTMASFTFDPGPNPQLGQTWDLNETLEIAGIPIHLTGARLTEDAQFSQDELLYRIEFTFRTPTDLPRIISSFMFNIDREETRGASVIQQWGYPGVFKASMLFLQVPQEPQEFGFERFRITLQGPWEIRWQIPWIDEPQLQERAMRQEEIKDTRYGVTLSVEQADFSTQSTIVGLAAQGLPEGSRLLNILPYDPAKASFFDWKPLYLVTDQGHKFEQAMDISWQPERDTQYDLFRLVFDPIPDQAEKVTFHIPAIELFISGQAAFDIEIPGEVRFHPEEFLVPDLVLHDRQSETYTRWLSDPWEVDISVEVAGYSLHFTRAQLEFDHNTNQVRLNLTSETANRDEDGKYLSTFNISSVTHPDGHRESGIDINEMWRLSGLISDRILNEYHNADQEKTTFMIEFCNLDCNDLLPGKYWIEIDGVTVWIAGSWDLEMHFENQ
jgi:hypothetical protein